MAKVQLTPTQFKILGLLFDGNIIQKPIYGLATGRIIGRNLRPLVPEVAVPGPTVHAFVDKGLVEGRWKHPDMLWIITDQGREAFLQAKEKHELKKITQGR